MKKRQFFELISILIFLSLTGCAKKESNNVKSYTTSIEAGETTEDISKVKINKNNIDLNNFKDNLNNLESSYNYPEYYMTIEEAEKLLSYAETTKECNKYKSLDLTYKDIYNLLYNNLRKDDVVFDYLKNKPENIDFIPILYKAVCGAFEDETNIHEDYCLLKDVTIIIEDKSNNYTYESSPAGEYFFDENTIKLYYETITESYNAEKKRLLENNESCVYENLEDYFSSVLQHELNHVRQWICNCRKESGQVIEALNVFGMYLIESSAESQLCYDRIISKDNTDFDSFDFVYFKERRSQAQIMLYGLLKENFSHKSFNETFFNTDLKQFLEIYDIKTPEELVEFFNINYTLETLNSRSTLAEHLITNYKPTMGEFEDMVGYTHKIYILKNNIKDLMDKVYNEEIGLEESIYLYQFFNAYAIEDSYKFEKDEYDNYRYIYNDSFMKDILHLENTFYKFLADAFNYNLDEIKEYAKSECFSSGYFVLGSYKEITDKKNRDWGISDDTYKIVDILLEKYPEIKEISFHYSHLGGSINIFEEEVEKYQLENSLVREKEY